MTQDVLAPFRRPGSMPAAPPEKREGEPQATPSAYRAYGLASGTARPVRLEIRPKGNLAAARPYSSLSEIVYNRADYSALWLQFPGIKFTIKGSALKPVVDALVSGMCEWIAELDEAESAAPGQPVITSITAAKATATPAPKPTPQKEV